MIKPEGLRIGNLVTVTSLPFISVPTNKAFIISEITLEGGGAIKIEPFSGSSPAIYKIRFKDIEPLPLTDTWRGRLRLVYRANTNDWLWRFNGIRWSLSKHEIWRKAEFKYVHEIQNLFYALYDTELRIKELANYN